MQCFGVYDLDCTAVRDVIICDLFTSHDKLVLPYHGSSAERRVNSV